MFKLQCSKLFIFLFPLIHKRRFQTFPILKSGEKRQSVERLSRWFFDFQEVVPKLSQGRWGKINVVVRKEFGYFFKVISCPCFLNKL